jgi:hypothetical protein
MDSQAVDNVVEITKTRATVSPDILRDFQKTVAKDVEWLGLFSSAVKSLACGELEASAFDNLRDDAYSQMIITMVDVSERHGVDLYSDVNQGRAFRRVAILEAEIAARSAMVAALRHVKASGWDAYVYSGPHDSAAQNQAPVTSQPETRAQRLETAVQTFEANLVDLSPELSRQLEPLARLIAEHAIPQGLDADRARHALGESAYRVITELGAHVTMSYGFDVTRDNDACDVFHAIMLRTAHAIADELLTAATAPNGAVPSTTIH